MGWAQLVQLDQFGPPGPIWLGSRPWPDPQFPLPLSLFSLSLPSGWRRRCSAVSSWPLPALSGTGEMGLWSASSCSTSSSYSICSSWPLALAPQLRNPRGHRWFWPPLAAPSASAAPPDGRRSVPAVMPCRCGALLHHLSSSGSRSTPLAGRQQRLQPRHPWSARMLAMWWCGVLCC
jgi:hypothetical protein